MKRLLSSTLTLLVFLSALSSGAGADAQKPLRHLRFKVAADVRTTTNLIPHGFNQTGTPTTVTQEHGEADGTIDIDVMGVTGDGGLTVQISEQDRRRPSAATPVGIFADGYVVVNAGKADAMNDEELALLPFLAPQLIAGHDATVGSAWTLRHQDGTVEHRLDVHVDKTDANLVDATIQQSITDGGVAALTQTSRSSVEYNNALTVPKSVTITMQRTTGVSDRSTKTNFSATYTLLEDSMAPAAAP